jgi:GntR family transcriptional regulator
MKQRNTAGAREFAFHLDSHSGVPVYRQLIDQVLGAVAMGALVTGDQLPTVRQVAVDLAINPNTVVRAYREMEIRGILDTQQGAGTFIAEMKEAVPQQARERQLAQLTSEFAARAGASGFSLDELMKALRAMQEPEPKRRKS